jgi:hypothetical protein
MASMRQPKPLAGVLTFIHNYLFIARMGLAGNASDFHVQAVDLDPLRA